MASEFDFRERLAFSKGVRARCDDDTLIAMIPSARAIRDGTEEEDRRGIDKVLQLSSGRTLAVDIKCRDAGCSQWWGATGPDLALERWSVVDRVVGWTLDPSKRTDLVLFLFAPTDTRDCFLVGFHHLRMAYLRFGASWMTAYRRARQRTGPWESECVFVPAAVVLGAITAISKGQTLLNDKEKL